MEHVVFFPAHDGTPAFRRVDGLEDAVRLVEHLRNVEGVSEVSCCALTEVPLAFRAWYRVEVPAGAETVVPVQPTAEVAPDQAPVPPADSVEAVELAPERDEEPVLVSSNGQGQEPAKSLGFFA